MSSIIPLFFSIRLHVFLLYIILTVAFWKVVSPMATTHLNHELSSMISGVATKSIHSNPEFIDALSKNKGPIKKGLSALLDTVRGADDRVRTVANNAAWSWNSTVLLLLLLDMLLSLTESVSTGNLTFGQIGMVVVENLLTFTLVAPIEYLFFIMIASKTIPVKPSAITQTVYNKLSL